MPKKKPRLHSERVRLVLTTFGSKKEKRESFRVERKTKDGFTVYGVNRAGYSFTRRIRHVESSKADTYARTLHSKALSRLKPRQRISITAQVYKGKMNRRTGSLVKGIAGEVQVKLLTTKKTRREIARDTKRDAKKALNFVLEGLHDFALKYNIEYGEENE